MLSTVLLGIASSIASEVITWINKKLSGTVLVGDGAWLLSAAVAIILATAKVLMSGIPTDWVSFTTECAMIWATSQVFFIWIVQQFNVDVPSAGGKIVTS